MYSEKATIFLRNLHRRRFGLCSQIYDGEFAKFCGLLRIYELYVDVISFISFLLFNLLIYLLKTGSEKIIY